MTSPTPYAAETVHDLQKRAELAARSPQRRPKRLSRAARLHLIDTLSRTGGAGLALFAGAAIFIAVSNGRDFPLRAGVWLILMMATLYVCRRLRRDFRAGEKIASKPFRWRAWYTSALCVLSAAFGAGALISAPVGAGGDVVWRTSIITLVAATGAGAAHLAHGRSLAAMFAPATVFALAAIARDAGLISAAIVATCALIAAGGLLFASRRMQSTAAARFPRTGFSRREKSELEAAAASANSAPGIAEAM
ncbi:MAG: hypothetical protein AAGJ87_10565 [Pseudomonadota bacterium]